MRMTSVLAACLLLSAQPPPSGIPSDPLAFGAFTARFAADGSFSLEGPGWPAFKGSWKPAGSEIEIVTPGGPEGCDKAGRYKRGSDGQHLHARRRVGRLRAAADDPGSQLVASIHREREGPGAEDRPDAGAKGRRASPGGAGSRRSWPSFRGPRASGVAEGQNLPDAWDGAKGENILWRTPIPGPRAFEPDRLGRPRLRDHRGQQQPERDVPPGLYGDGDASDDRSPPAVDASTRSTSAPGRSLWERVADEGAPRNKRHIKSTYASATPATDGRIVVASFGSQGVHAYDVERQLPVEGRPRPARHRRLRHSDVTSGDRRARRSSGTASSSCSATRRRTRSCSRSKAETGETVWKTPREELPSWGTPTVAITPVRPAARDQRVEFHPRLRSARRARSCGGSAAARRSPRRRRSSPRGCSSSRAAARPSGRSSSVRAGRARRPHAGRADKTSSDAVAWSRTGPRIRTCRRRSSTTASLYVLANNGVFDAYDLKTGEEIYRQRLDDDRQRLQRVAGRGRRQDLPVERGRRHPRRRRRTASSSSSRRTRWASC